MMVGKNKGSIDVVGMIPKGSIGAELGVWRGESSRLFREAVGDEGALHLVDSWSVEPYQYDPSEHGSYEKYLDRYQKIVGSRDPEDFKRFYDGVYNKVANWALQFDNVLIHRKSTDEFFSGLENPLNPIEEPDRRSGSLDWVYVDASHAYEQVLRDLENSRKAVRRGGMILGDDYYEGKPGVLKAVNVFASSTGLRLEKFGFRQYCIKL